MKFPLVGSLVLFSLFLAFKYLPKEIVNAILSGGPCLVNLTEQHGQVQGYARLTSAKHVGASQLAALQLGGVVYSTL